MRVMLPNPHSRAPIRRADSPNRANRPQIAQTDRLSKALRTALVHGDAQKRGGPKNSASAGDLNLDKTRNLDLAAPSERYLGAISALLEQQGNTERVESSLRAEIESLKADAVDRQAQLDNIR